MKKNLRTKTLPGIMTRPAISRVWLPTIMKRALFRRYCFRKKREKLLRRLDSLVLLTKETTARRSQLSYFWNGAARIKNLVWKTSVFAVETLIDRFRWEREYVDWQKTAIKNAKESLMRKISASSDSGFLAEIDLQQKRLNIRMDSLVKTGMN